MGSNQEAQFNGIEPKVLRDLFIEQGKKYDRSDLDESKVIENYIQYVRN